MAALTWAALTSSSNATAPTIDRVKADAVGCNTAASAAPCFDDGNTFGSTETATAIAGKVLTFNGLAAHTMPITDGQAVACSGCTTGLFVVSVSNPPTQDARATMGQIGSANNGFTVTLSAAPGVTGTGHAFTFGCSGTSGTGSNCIDIAFSILTAGTYATAAALATCGENNASGAWTIPSTGPNAGVQTVNSPPFALGNGICQTNGVGSLVRNFIIGTDQSVWGGGAAGGGVSNYDDGILPGGATVGGFNQSATFTCHIAAAAVVQCIKGPVYASGIATSIGLWSSGSTFVEYGDNLSGTSRSGALLGYVGGQSYPIANPGTGQTPGLYRVTATSSACPVTSPSGEIFPKFDLTVGTSGTLINAYPSSAVNALGIGMLGGCTFTVPTSASCTGSACGSVTVPLGPFEGAGGIGTQATDTNLKNIQLYDNTMLPGNPLSVFEANCPTATGYCEPGLAVMPFGLFLGAQVIDSSTRIE